MSGRRGGGARRGGRTRTSRRALDRASAEVLAREISASQRAEILRRHAILTRNKGVVMVCREGVRQKVAYPTRAAAEAANRDLMAVGDHPEPGEAYPCELPLFDHGGHWHLRTRIKDQGAGR